MEYDLYRNDGSILFSKETELVTGYDTQTIVAAGYVKGFKQLNSSHVVIVDNQHHCIRLLNRETKSNRVIAGKCGFSGSRDGTSSLFDGPWGIEVNEKQSGQLLITEHDNHALRSVDIASGTVGTVIRTGFNRPKGLAWYNGRLLVCNEYYVSEVIWDSNGAVINNQLTATTTSGIKYGDFSTAQFYTLYDIQQWKDGFFLVAENGRLRLLNMFTRKVLPVCVDTTSCTSSTSFSYGAYSVLVNKEAVYVGGSRDIQKLRGQ